MAKPIEKITIKGYKSIRSLEDFPLTSLNVLIGANGAGKSNFVTFFRVLRELVQQNLQSYVREEGSADALLHLGPKVTTEIVGDLHFPPNRYSFKLKRTVRDELFFASEETHYEDKTYPLGRGHREAKLKERKDMSGVMGGASVQSYVYDSVTSWTVYHFHDTSSTAAVRSSRSVRDYEQLHPGASNLAAFLLHLRKTDQQNYELIRDTVRLVAPFFNDFRLRPQPNGQDEVVLLEWSQVGSDYPFHPSQLSDGTLRFICMTTALLQPRPPATMLFDEPELGLHPYALTTLAGLLRKAATESQVIVSTQSAALIDEFETEQVIVVDRKEGASVFRRLDSEELANWLKDYSLGELWRKNVFEGGPAHE